MEFVEGSSFGYDQVTIGGPIHYNKGDSSLLYRDRMRPSNEVRQYMNEREHLKKSPAGESAFQYYLRKNIKDEIEKYEMRKPQYTGIPSLAPESSGYPLCETKKTPDTVPKTPPLKESMVSRHCTACSGHDAVDYKKKYDNMLFLILVVVVAFCMSQFANIQRIQKQISDIISVPLKIIKPPQTQL